MSSDPFSDILRLTEPESVVSGAFTAGGRWALHFPRPGKLKYSAIARGTCWLRLDGQRKGILLEEGDVVLLPGRDGFVIASDLNVPARDGHRALSAKGGGFSKLGAGSECVVVSGMVTLHPSSGELLTEVLPAIIHVRAVYPQAAPLRWIVEQILQERNSTLPGASIASAQLAQLMFVQILRAHLASAGTLPSGWLRAIGDPRIAPALRLIHSDPGRSWKLDALAKASGMSRTSFAVHFKSAAGVAPLEYLTAWRMRLAQRSLRDEETSVFEVGKSLGYSSESSFSNAFKRVTGTAPRNYRNAVRRAPVAALAVDRARTA